MRPTCNLLALFCRGDQGLKALFDERFGPLFHLIGNSELSALTDLPYSIARSVKNPEIPYQENLIPILESLPIYELMMTKKGLTEIPWWVFHLQKLQILTLPQNEITELPPKIIQLKNLTKINLENNMLKALPENIGQMKSMEKLYLDFNHIESLPESIGDLENLYSLCLEDSEIRKLPQSMKKLKRLSWFSMEKTPLGKHFGLTYGEYISVEEERFLEYLATEIKKEDG